MSRVLREVELDIVDLDSEGRGVGRDAGKVLFVDGALPGERVRAGIRHRHRKHDEGETLEVLRASADRVTPACAHFGVCGGCALQHLAPSAQLQFKQRQVRDALRRIGRFEPPEFAPPVTSPEWGYRRRARLSAKWLPGSDRLLVGFRARNKTQVAELRACKVLDARIGERLPALAEALGALTLRERLPQIEVATDAQSVALVLRVLEPPGDADRAQLAALAEREGWMLYLQDGGPGSVRRLDDGAPEPLETSPDGSALRLAFAPTDFVQVNAAASQAMVRQALDWLAPARGARVLELFAGLGNFTLPLAAAGCAVTAVEGEAGLVEGARANLTRNGLNATLRQADLYADASAGDWLDADYDGLLLDPPRSGALAILERLRQKRIPRVLYVSCHPGTLARDAALLLAQGYRLSRIGIIDMFPHTAHIETMALFERGQAARSGTDEEPGSRLQTRDRT